MEAVTAFRQAMEIDPLQLNARINYDTALANAVPTWHFAMMNDATRNAAYDEAIRRVAPGRAVLDIGTGAGLLALMLLTDARRAARNYSLKLRYPLWPSFCAGKPEHSMKGFVPTPSPIVDLMVDKLFGSGAPSQDGSFPPTWCRSRATCTRKSGL